MSSVRARKGKGKGKAKAAPVEESDLEEVLSIEQIREIDAHLKEEAAKELQSNVDIPLVSAAVEDNRPQEEPEASPRQESVPPRESDGDVGEDSEVASVDGGGKGTIDVNSVGPAMDLETDDFARGPFLFGAFVASVGAISGATIAVWLVNKIL